MASSHASLSTGGSSAPLLRLFRVASLGRLPRAKRQSDTDDWTEPLLRRIQADCPECGGQCRVCFTAPSPTKRRRTASAPQTDAEIEKVLSDRYERWVTFRRGLPEPEYGVLKPSMMGKLHLLHQTAGQITEQQLTFVKRRGRVMMNRIYAKQSTSSKNAIVQEHPILKAKLEASQQAQFRLEVEQRYYREMVREGMQRAASYAWTAAQSQARVLIGLDHRHRALAALRAFPRRETPSLPLQVAHPAADPGVVGGEDFLGGLLDGADEELVLDFSFGGPGV